MSDAYLTSAAPTQNPVVLHVDLDCFYAACERLREPGLEGEAVVVGMGYDAEEKRGAVATASYEAREFGAHSAMPIGEALRLLPRIEDAEEGEAGGHYRPVDMEFYREVASEVRVVLEEFADVLQPVGIDEAYLDVSESASWDGARDFAEELKREVAEATGLTASVGVAPTKSAAKVASDREKPDGLVVVRPGEVREFFAPLDVEEIHGVGPVTARKLREMEIETAGAVAASDPEALVERFGSRGREMWMVTRGRDPRPVEPPGRPKSVSKEKSLEPTGDPEKKRKRVKVLAALVAERARRKGALYRTIGIKVVTPPFDVSTREKTLPGPVDDPDLVEDVALELLEEFREEQVRKLGVRVSNLSFAEEEQSSLDSWGGEGTVEEPSFPYRGREGPRQERLDSFRDGEGV